MNTLSQASMCQLSISWACLTGASSRLMSTTYIWNRTPFLYSSSSAHTHTASLLNVILETLRGRSLVCVRCEEAWSCGGCKFALQKCEPVFFSHQNFGFCRNIFFFFYLSKCNVYFGVGLSFSGQTHLKCSNNNMNLSSQKAGCRSRPQTQSLKSAGFFLLACSGVRKTTVRAV